MTALEGYKELNEHFDKKYQDTEAYKIFSKASEIYAEYDRSLFLNSTIGEDLSKLKALLKSFNEYYKDFIKKEYFYNIEEFYYFRNRATNDNKADYYSITQKQLKEVFSLLLKRRNNILQFKYLLIEKINELQEKKSQPVPFVSEEPQPQNIKSLQWKGEAIELTELVQALIESKLLNPELTQKEIYSRFKAFFEIDFDHEDKKKKIKKRTNTLTPFLEKLMISIENFIDGKD
ncbi:RteC domain-containing protein [Capnocytophaga canis]|uniref:RteC domain-containing protein n=1 Tax=Capnocytophaga canis TaxID=1848903 RepID=UPI0037D1522C